MRLDVNVCKFKYLDIRFLFYYYFQKVYIFFKFYLIKFFFGILRFFFMENDFKKVK